MNKLQTKYLQYSYNINSSMSLFTFLFYCLCKDVKAVFNGIITQSLISSLLFPCSKNLGIPPCMLIVMFVAPFVHALHLPQSYFFPPPSDSKLPTTQHYTFSSPLACVCLCQLYYFHRHDEGSVYEAVPSSFCLSEIEGGVVSSMNDEAAAAEETVARRWR